MPAFLSSWRIARPAALVFRLVDIDTFSAQHGVFRFRRGSVFAFFSVDFGIRDVIRDVVGHVFFNRDVDRLCLAGILALSTGHRSKYPENTHVQGSTQCVHFVLSLLQLIAFPRTNATVIRRSELRKAQNALLERFICCISDFSDSGSNHPESIECGYESILCSAMAACDRC